MKADVPRKLHLYIRIVVIALLLATTMPALARISASQGIANLRLALSGSNAALSWPSLTNQAFYVQYAPTLDPGVQWVTLAANFPAAVGTNWTTFIHSNSVTYPGPCGTNGTNSGLIGPPGLNGMTTVQTDQGTYFITRDGEALTYEDLLPYPWNPRFWPQPPLLAQDSTTIQSTQTESSGSTNESGCPPTIGFYRVFIPAPQAIGDVFSVAQGSTTNQLSILANDRDPEGTGFLLSDVSPAAHGTIQYNDSATVFWYTPASSYSGADSFTYTITNEFGGIASTQIWVFVNKPGNANPTAGSLDFTLLTNQTQVSFAALTNTSDPNSDPLSVLMVFAPTHGTALFATNGTMTYTRTSRIVVRDEFSYIITDGQGGFVSRTVSINPQDTDGDGMPDEWEMQQGLNPTTADATADPDSDGLPNLAEYKLQTNPHASDSPLALTAITNNQKFAAYARIPLALNCEIDQQPITLRLNDQATSSTLNQAADGSWYINWDAGYLTNGPGAIRLSFQYNPNADPPAPRIQGPTKQVTVSNEVIFNELNSEFSDSLWLDMRFPYQNATWRIELYDEDTSGLVYFEGSTTEGNVHGGWDLTYGGQQISFDNIRADVFVAPTGTSFPSKPNAKRWFSKEVAGGVGDNFVVAWGWDWNSLYLRVQRTATMLDGVVNIIGNPALDDEYTLKPAQNIPYADAFEYHYPEEKDTLIAALSEMESGNFFWFGHGDDSSVSGDGRKSSISAGDVEQALMNKKHRSKPPKYSYRNKHPYRLVILNGCQTYSADWAHAFGFDYSPNGTTNDVLAYIRQGRQPQAFVGWTNTVQVPSAANPPYYHSQYAEGLAYLFSAWMEGYSLEECMRQYADTMAVYSYSGHNSWRISGAAVMYRGAR